MKLTEKRLSVLRKLAKNINAKISPEMAEKLKKKGLIEEWGDHFLVTKEGWKELEKVFGDNFLTEKKK